MDHACFAPVLLDTGMASRCMFGAFSYFLKDASKWSWNRKGVYIHQSGVATAGAWMDALTLEASDLIAAHRYEQQRRSIFFSFFFFCLHDRNLYIHIPLHLCPYAHSIPDRAGAAGKENTLLLPYAHQS